MLLAIQPGNNTQDLSEFIQIIETLLIQPGWYSGLFSGYGKADAEKARDFFKSVLASALVSVGRIEIVHEDRLLDVMDIFHRRVTVAEEMCPDYKSFEANQTLFEADLRHQVTMVAKLNFARQLKRLEESIAVRKSELEQKHSRKELNQIRQMLQEDETEQKRLMEDQKRENSADVITCGILACYNSGIMRSFSALSSIWTRIWMKCAGMPQLKRTSYATARKNWQKANPQRSAPAWRSARKIWMPMKSGLKKLRN